jgi:hypothetical protein
MAQQSSLLLPAPREVNYTSGVVALAEKRLIVIPDSSLLFEAQTAQNALVEFAGLQWQIVAGKDYKDSGLLLSIDPSIGHAEGYNLRVGNNKIYIRGADAAGVFYGVCTLRQLLQQHEQALPSLEINDWPDFPARGVMLDVSRDKVPKMETLYALVDRLAGWKINQVQLYMEHTFAYQNHPVVWAEASPFTGQEIMELDVFCRQRHIQLVPNQNSLGHMERWLKFDQYRDLAECPDGFSHHWFGKNAPPSSLNPIDPRSIELMASLYDELLPHFTSNILNVGGDEPWELGQCRSKEEMERIGEGRLYLNYILKLYAEVSKRGKTMMMWDDIIIKYTELVPELPKDLIAMVWGYEANHPFEERCKVFASVKVPFYVCPGTSSWNTITGRTENAIGNLRNAAINGLKYGAIGFLITDWGDNGHWQILPASYLGFAYGAALSWAQSANLEIDLPAVVSLFAFEDASGTMGKLAFDLGNVYRVPGHARPNGHMLPDLLRTPADKISLWKERYHEYGGEDAESFRIAIQAIDSAMQTIGSATMRRADADIIRNEYELAADLLRHACQRGMLIFDEPQKSPAELARDLDELIGRYQEAWMTRNRPGGFKESVARFNASMDSYKNK